MSQSFICAVSILIISSFPFSNRVESSVLAGWWKFKAAGKHTVDACLCNTEFSSNSQHFPSKKAKEISNLSQKTKNPEAVF